MNKEDFVTYEQALALKKLGFREDCLYYYKSGEIYPNCGGLSAMIVDDYYDVHNYKSDVTLCDAPTLAQAQKWLLKYKKHYVNPNWDVDKDLWVVDIKTKDEIIEVLVEGNPFFNSYEQALSAGITECLKLLDK